MSTPGSRAGSWLVAHAAIAPTRQAVTRLRARLPDRDDRGYVAVATALLMTVLMGLLGFGLDVGRWYLTGEQEQRAADAAALAGVPNLPGDKTAAFAAAQKLSTFNGFQNGSDTVSVVPGIDGKPTRLRVTVTKTVDNVIGPLLGIPKTTITRSAVADYAGPVPMGSPCNEFGNDPDAGSNRGSACPTDDVGTGNAGQFWANVGSPRGAKTSGDAYLDNTCTSSQADSCPGGVNTDFDPNGYFYSVTLTEPVSNLVIQAFDPAHVVVGDRCDTAANGMALSGTPAENPAAKIPAANTVVTDPKTRYLGGASSPYCTGDVDLGLKGGLISTTFQVRDPGANVWDPLSFPVRAGCSTTHPGYNANLAVALDKTKGGFDPALASAFRQWKDLCTISYAPAGTYLVQVNTQDQNAVQNPTGKGGHNRFALRAFGGGSTDKDSISISAYNKMAIFANLPGAKTTFHLARVPSGAAGQVLNLRLFDIGDSPNTGTINLLAPEDSGVTFGSCTFTGAAKGSASSCSLTADSTYNGKWASIAVPIPPAYTCNDPDPTACWVRLQYSYGTGNQPTDTTSWSASIEGDPVRLVE